MRGSAVLLLGISLAGCTCEGLPPELEFHCEEDADCVSGFHCAADGVCREVGGDGGPDGGPDAGPDAGAGDAGVLATLSSGGALADTLQTSAQHTNLGVLGQATPAVEDGGTVQRSVSHTNYGGFFAIDRRAP